MKINDDFVPMRVAHVMVNSIMLQPNECDNEHSELRGAYVLATQGIALYYCN